MPAHPVPLPEDIAVLKALLSERDAALAERDSTMAQLRNTISTLEQALSIRTLEIEQLKLQISKLRRMQFGQKSEKLDWQIDQLEARLEDLLSEEGEAEVVGILVQRDRRFWPIVTGHSGAS